MTGAPIDAKNTEVFVVFVVSVDANSVKDITSGANASRINEYRDEIEIYLEEEWNKEAYQDILNIEI